MMKYSSLFLMLMAGAAVAGSSLEPANYPITVTLSPRAAATLSQSGEMIHISAVYYGMATKPEDGDEMGQVFLGNEDVDIPGADTVYFGKTKLDGKALKKAQNEQAYVNINVYTSRKKFENNLLNCGLFEDRLEVAAENPIKIDCKLIAEE